MALKAEPAPLDCIQVTLKCEDVEEVRVEDDGAEALGPRAHTPPGRWPPLPSPSRRRTVPPAGEEPEPLQSWEQEYLVGNSPGGSGRALCMVCGQELHTPSARSARRHILRQHPHTLGLSPGEKSNILEAWSEGVALLDSLGPPSPPSTGRRGRGGRDQPGGDPPETPAEIVVLLDSEEKPESQSTRNRPRGLRPLQSPAAPTVDVGTKKPRNQRYKELPGEVPPKKKKGRGRSSAKAKDWAGPDRLPGGGALLGPSPRPKGHSPGVLEEAQMASERRGTACPAALTLSFHPSSAPSAGLRGTLDLQVIRVHLDEPPAVSLLQDWPKAPQGPRTAGAGDPPGWQAVLTESGVAAAREQPEAGPGE
uniref:Spindlin interactor and repressor of chromatin binding n=1 Tax=Monodelphis domestica TaxID=13616 RepID=A0A5F8GEV7_MONDO